MKTKKKETKATTKKATKTTPKATAKKDRQQGRQNRACQDCQAKACPALHPHHGNGGLYQKPAQRQRQHHPEHGQADRRRQPSVR